MKSGQILQNANKWIRNPLGIKYFRRNAQLIPPHTLHASWSLSVPSIEGNVTDNSCTCLYQTIRMFSFQWPLYFLTHPINSINSLANILASETFECLLSVLVQDETTFNTTLPVLLRILFFATKHSLQLMFSATCRNYEVVNISDSKLRLEHQSRIFGASKWFQLWDPQSLKWPKRVSFWPDFCLCSAAKIKFVSVESDVGSFPSVSGTDSRAVPLM